MAKYGQKKQPAAIVKMKGNYRPSRYKDEIAESGILFLCEIPEAPITLNDIGRNLWQNIISDSINIKGYFAIRDMLMFEQLCYTYQLMRESQEKINKFGIYTISDSGNGKDIKQSSFLRSYMDLVKTFIVLCREFGLSPSARAGLKISERGEKFDPLAAFSL